MLRRNALVLGTRTPGYVFWRQRTLIELEKSKRSYLVNERPYPIAEITRRMTRVRSKYTSTNDFHEQNLLRGEYKYFTGKLLDLRRAKLSDLVAFVEIGGVFGFWDSAQIDRVMDELILHLEELTSNQLIHLLVALSNVRKHQSKLYRTVALELVGVVKQMAFEDVLLLVKACEMEDPPPLLESLLVHVASNLDRLTASTAAAVLVTMTCAPRALQNHYEAMVQELKSIVVDDAEELSLLEIANVCEAAACMETLDITTREALVRLFVSRIHEACAPSLAMMFYACESISLARAAEDRVMALIQRFSTAELYAVSKVYLTALADMDGLLVPAAVAGPVSGAAVEAGVPAHVRRIPSLAEDLGAPLSLTSSERVAAESQRRELARIAQELMEQLLQHLMSTTVHAQPHVYLGLMRCYAECKQHADVLGPQYRRVVHELCAKTVAAARDMDVSMLVEFMMLANQLGQLSLHAAVIATMDAIRGRIVVASASSPSSAASRDGAAAASVAVSSSDAAQLFNVLHGLTSLNALQRRKLEADILPLLRRRVGEDDADLLRY